MKPDEILKEVCLNCKHTKRYHNKGSCSQPTCMCNCFIESGLIYTTDILDAFNQGKEQNTKRLADLREKIWKLFVEEDFTKVNLDRLFDEAQEKGK